MTASRFNQYWILIAILLAAIIIAGALIIWPRLSAGEPVDISTSPAQELQGEIYIGGAVNNPGIYSLAAGDTIEDLIQAAGGYTPGADLNSTTLHIPYPGEGQTQKININLAEAWLLEALPGIGESRAQAIIDYRERNGSFRNINEITSVEGIGAATYEQIKDLITVGNQ
jgi:competence protein ComEA